jgi:sugar phosphate isomerase/epimerase
MWMRDRFERPCDFFCAGVRLGFRSFEVNGVATLTFYDDVHPGEFTIRSLHDPAPAAPNMTVLAQKDIVFTSLDDERRRQAVATAKNSIDVAVRYGAKGVILHSGQVEVDPDLQDTLEQLLANGQIESTEANTIRALQASERMVNYDAHMTALRHSLDDLIPYAIARDVFLGIENRRRIHQVPNFDEMRWLLAYYQSPAFGYWHDTGHAEVLAALGLTPHADWLRTFGSRLVGIHMHDVIGNLDHRAPGTGTVDWSGLAPFVPDQGLRTAEVASDASEEALTAGVALLAETGWIHD